MAEGEGILSKSFFAAVLTSSLVFTAATLTPLLGPFVDVFIPLPVFYYYARFGRLMGTAVFMSSLAAVAVISLIFRLEMNAMVLFLVGSFGLVLSEIFRKALSLEKTVFYSLLAVLTLGSVFLLYHFLMTGEDPLHLIESTISEGIQESIAVYAQLGISSEQLNELKTNAPRIIQVILSLFPALATIFAASFVLTNVLAGRAILRKTGVKAPDFGDLAFWKIPDQMVWFVIAAGGLILVPRDDLRTVGLNLLILFLFFYLLQGFAIVSYYFRKKNVPLVFRGAIYFLIFAQNFLFLVVAAIGFADVWIDFRKKTKPPAAGSRERE